MDLAELLRQRRAAAGKTPPSTNEPESDSDESDSDESDSDDGDIVIDKPRKRAPMLRTKQLEKSTARTRKDENTDEDGDESLAGLLAEADLEYHIGNDNTVTPWARVLLLGPAKMGKTVSIAASAPEPILLINCDGKDAAQAARRIRADNGASPDGLFTVEVTTKGEWLRAVRVALASTERGLARTVIVDSISLLNDMLERELGRLHKNNRNKYEKWSELHDLIMHKGIHKLRNIEAHLFIVAHQNVVDETPAGILPMMTGKAAKVVPGVINDWILFDYDEDEKPRRGFLVGPQKKWGYAGRNIKRSVRIPADAMELIEELGLTP